MSQQFSRKNGHSFTRRRINNRVSLLRRCILRALHRFLACSGQKPGANSTYSKLTPHAALPSPPPPLESDTGSARPSVFRTNELDADNLVSLKISLLGDCQIGKTSFLVSLSHFVQFSFFFSFFFFLNFVLKWVGLNYVF
jgi:Rab family protein